MNVSSNRGGARRLLASVIAALLLCGAMASFAQADEADGVTFGANLYESRPFGGPAPAAEDAATYFASLPTGAPGYCITTLATLNGASNGISCGGNPYGLAVHTIMAFDVSVARTWSFRFAPDAGDGGILLIDGVIADSTRGASDSLNGDFWNPAFNEPTAHFEGSASLAVGSHTIELYTFEGCCDGPWGAQYQSLDGTWLPITEGAPSPDADGDGFADTIDNCVDDVNADQLDTDADGVGDACEEPTVVDTDEDGIADEEDNCVAVANAGQLDTDGDASGDACDADDDGDGTPDVTDRFPLDPNRDGDEDDNGIADTAAPTNADQCKKDGWRTFDNPSFKNQGQCVSSVQKAKH